MRGTMPRWTFCTSPANAHRVIVGSGGRMPKKTDMPPSSGSTRLRSASCPPQLLELVDLVGMLRRPGRGPGRSRRAGSTAPSRRRCRGPSRRGPEPRQRLRRDVPRQPLSSFAARPPAVLVHRAAAEHLEVLLRCAAPRPSRRRRCRGSWCRPSAPARCRRPASARACRPPRGSSGAMSMHVGELRAHPPRPALIRPGQATTIGLRVPPRWLAICLPHWNGVLPACAQAAGEVRRRVRRRPAPRSPPYCSISLSCCVGVEHDAVEERHLVERAGDRALHAGAVVAPDVEDRACCRARPSPRSASSSRPTFQSAFSGSRRRPPSAGRRASSACRTGSPTPGTGLGPLGELGVGAG